MRNQALILMYHRVTPHGVGVPDYSPNGIAVTPSEFENQMRFLREHYDVVPLSRITDSLRGSKSFDPKMCAVTFDDGWHDVYQYAFPVLKQFRIPATIYLTTGFIDEKAWFWEERYKYLLALLHQECTKTGKSGQSSQQVYRALAPYQQSDMLDVSLRHLPSWLSQAARAVRQWSPERRDGLIDLLEQFVSRLVPHAARPFMNWSEVQEMVQHGIDIGNHTDSHHALSDLAVDKAVQEIKSAAQRIRQKIGRDVPDFAYPYGKYNEQIRGCLEGAGIGSATTTRMGLVHPDSDPYALNRVNMCSDISAFRPLFAGRILGF